MRTHRNVVHARVPAELAAATCARAERLGLGTSDVVRQALVRELVEPADPATAAFVAAWLAGADAPEGTPK